MPEGDTIFRAATRLRQVLAGQQVAAVESPTRQLPREQLEPLIGSRVEGVESRGKHLLVHFERGQTLHSHLGMYGAWHIYEVGMAWRKPRAVAGVALRTATAQAVCFRPKILELLSAGALRQHRLFAKLGPDLLGEQLDAETTLMRFRQHPNRAIGDALLDQSIVSGIGNVYKSEVLFVLRIDPFQVIGKLTDEQLREVVERSRQLLRRNLTGHPRRTRSSADGVRLWVYRRVGEPCLVCGANILMRRQGDLGRSTYWCPVCQSAAAGDADHAAANG